MSPRFLYAIVLVFSIWISGNLIFDNKTLTDGKKTDFIAAFDITQHPPSKTPLQNAADIENTQKFLESIKLFYPVATTFTPQPQIRPTSAPSVSSNGTVQISSNDSVNANYPVTEKDLTLDAKSAIAYSLDDSSVFFNKNENVKLPIGSVTKLISALVVLDDIPVDATITISQAAVAQEGNMGNLRPDEQFKRDDLLRIMLVVSSNDAAYAFAEYLGFNNFVALMNKKVQELGLNETVFYDPAGLNDMGKATASDLLKMLKAVYTERALMDIVTLAQADVVSLQGIHHVLISTDQLINFEEKDISVIGGKTGYTDLARGSLALISRIKNRVVATIVLGSDDRFGDTMKLLRWIRDND